MISISSVIGNIFKDDKLQEFNFEKMKISGQQTKEQM